MTRRAGYRLATDEERILINSKNSGTGCWLLREPGNGKAYACPNPRREGSGVCAHHGWWEGRDEPEPAEPSAVADPELLAALKDTVKQPLMESEKAERAAKEGDRGAICDLCHLFHKSTRRTRQGIMRCAPCWKKGREEAKAS